MDAKLNKTSDTGENISSRNPMRQISVIIPTLNEEKIIGTTLDNLQELRKLGAEIILCDGQSTDNTVKIAKGKTDRLIILPEIRTRTIAKQRNLGASSAKGNFLVFMDADISISDPVKFMRRALEIFEKRPRLVALTSKIKANPSEATSVDNLIYSIISFLFIVSNNWLKQGRASGEFQMIKKEAFKKAGGYKENIAVGEDNELFYQLSKIGETRAEKTLTIYTSPRRAHAIGWPKLIYHWILNLIVADIFKKSVAKEWKAIR